MNSASIAFRAPAARFLASSAGLLLLAACAGSTAGSGTTAASAPRAASRMAAPSPDPRVGLKAGLHDAGEAIWNMRMVSHVVSPAPFLGITNSDLAFSGTNVIQGNYNGFQIWDISNPSAPRIRVGKLCPASQSDVSVFGHLLFVSAEAPSARLDCGTEAPRDPVSRDRIRGLRIFDITDIDNPKYLTNVQTCRGSHTHTVLSDPKDTQNVYVYISGTSSVRPADELAGCVGDANDPNTALFRIEVIKVPLAHPEQAAIVSSPRIFSDAQSGTAMGLINTASHGQSPADTGAGGRGGRAGGGRGGFQITAAMLVPLTATSTKADSTRNTQVAALMPMALLTPTSTKADSATYNGKVAELAKLGVALPTFGGGGRAGGGNAPPRGALTQCHDITVYPGVGLAGGACAGMGLLLDIRDPAHPRRIAEVADSNFSFWHSATFSNDGSMVLFSDEWGGGGAAYCRAADPKEWGADAIFKIVNGKMIFQSYYKLPAPQSAQENCVAHNGSLIPVPGRTIMVQAWYQGGISVFEWSDPAHPTELAFFDRGPNDGSRLVGGGYWSVYWYNGHIVGSEMQRGLDIFELTPSAALSQNEIDAAKTVTFGHFNAQDQPKFVWPASFALARAYTDQLERGGGLSAAQVSAVRSSLMTAERASGSERRAALAAVASQVTSYVSASSDKARVQWLAGAARDLATATR